MKLKSNSVTFAKPLCELSLVELFLELDRIHWRWKLAASVANWMMLAGFVVLPSAFSNSDAKFRLGPVALRIFAAALLLIGYLITGMLCWYIKNIMFQVESIFVPGFNSSLIGMLSSLFNVYGKIHSPGESLWNNTSISAFTLSTVFMVFYGTIAWNGNRKIDLIREHDINLAILQEQLDDPSLISMEEYTRRQLLKLLLADQNQYSFPQTAVRAPEMAYDPSERYPRQEEDGRVGLPPGLREDRELRRSGIIMSATVGHAGEVVGGYGRWSLA